MNSTELIQRSPLRALDQALSGGLGKGKLGMIVARHGAGKTPFVVGVALDHLMRGERVLHVALDHKVDHVREYYDQIFEEFVRSAHLDDPRGHHLEMERARRIHTYMGNSFTLEKLQTAVSFMREHASFAPSLLVVDGLDLATASAGDVETILGVARSCDAELWMTAVRHRDEPVTDPDGIPSPACRFKDLASVILELKTAEAKGQVTLLKPRTGGAPQVLPFVLDPTTMLVLRK